MYKQAFRIKGDTVTLRPNATSANTVAFNTVGTNFVRVLSDAAAFIVFGNSTANATLATGFPLVANNPETFMSGSSHCSAIVATGTCNIYLTAIDNK